jgi:hypothetical protein
MRDYDQLRKHWVAELERSGELAVLCANERALLERGSLDVFAAARLAEVRRRRTISRLLVAGAYLAFFASLAALVLDPLPAGALLFAVLSLLLLGRRFGKGSEERELLYEHLSRTRRWLDLALR